MSAPKSNNALSAGPPGDPAEDYTSLTEIGLAQLEALGTDFWTDFNPQDPGITILEILAYAITDLGYRTNFSITDILTPAPGEAHILDQQFHRARQILSSSPVTLQDMRKKILDLDGILNAWVYPYFGFEGFRGLRKIVVLPEEEQSTPLEQEAIFKKIHQVFWENRGLGEALQEIQLLSPHYLSLELDISLKKDFRPEEVLAEIYVRLEQYLEGKPLFRTLGEMLHLYPGRPGEIFNGPALKHGFIAAGDLREKASLVHGRELMGQLKAIPGILNFRRFKVLDLPGPIQQVMTLPVDSVVGRLIPAPDNQVTIKQDQIARLLDPRYFKLKTYVGSQPYKPDMEACMEAVAKLKSQTDASKKAPSAQNFPVPEGKYRNLNQYFSVQYDFPEIYKLRPDALDPKASATRKAEVNQLKGYMLLFDQVLTNYFSQLSNFGLLFSWDPSIRSTYFFQSLQSAVVDLSRFLGGNLPQQALFKSYVEKGQHQWEGVGDFLQRRGQLLGHVLATLGRSLRPTLEGQAFANTAEAETYNIQVSQQLLGRYPELSAERGRGGNPFDQDNPENRLSGLQKLICTLFNFPEQDEKLEAVYQRFMQLNHADLEQHQYFGNQFIRSNGSLRLNLPVLMQLGTQVDNYEIFKPDGAKRYTYTLYGQPEPGQPVYEFDAVNTFNTYDEALDTVTELADLVRQFDTASERMYILDHILLTPQKENLNFGLSLLNGDRLPFLTTDLWYPLISLEALQLLDQENAEIVYLDQLPPRGTKYSFRFLITGMQGDLPYPVYGPEGMKLPMTFHADSAFLEESQAGALLQHYLKKFDVHLQTNPRKLGQSVLDDFVAETLPKDWRSSGKAEELANWGRYVLRALTQRLTGVAEPAPEAFGAKLLDALKTTPDPQQEVSFLLIYVKRYYSYFFENTGAQEALLLGTAVWQDLKPAPVPSSFFSPLAQEYLAVTGRLLGKAWLEKSFSASVLNDPRAFGNALEQLFIQNANAWSRQKMEAWALNQLDKVYPRLFPDSEGRDEQNLELLLSPEIALVLLDNPENLKLLASAGREFLSDYLNNLIGTSIGGTAVMSTVLYHQYVDFFTAYGDSPPLESPGSPGSPGNHAGILLGSSFWGPGGLPDLGSDSPPEPGEGSPPFPGLGSPPYSFLTSPPFSGNGEDWPEDLPTEFRHLIELAEADLMEYIHQFYSPETAVGGVAWKQIQRDIQGTGFAYNSGPKTRFFGAVMLQVLAWTLRHILAGGKAGEEALHKLIASMPEPSEALLAEGKKAIFFYAEKVFLTQGKTGADLVYDLVRHYKTPQPDVTDALRTDALAAIGGYILSAYLDKQEVPAGQSLVRALVPGAWPDPPPKSGPLKVAEATKAINGQIHHLQEKLNVYRFDERGNVPVPTAAPRSENPMGEIGKLALLQLLLEQADKVLGSAKACDQLIKTKIIMPAEVGQLPVPLKKAMTDAGATFMYYFLNLAFPWQRSDPAAMARALALDFPLLFQSLTLIPPLRRPPKPPEKEIRYSVELELLPPLEPEAAEIPFPWLYVPVIFRPDTTFSDRADVTAAIDTLIQSTALVLQDKMAFQDLYHPIVRPVVPPASQAPPDRNTIDPYSNCLTVVLPDWPVRFQDASFKALMERTIEEECPAYLYPRILWLDFEAFREFEALYKDWEAEFLNTYTGLLYSGKLFSFLQSHLKSGQ